MSLTDDQTFHPFSQQQQQGAIMSHPQQSSGHQQQLPTQQQPHHFVNTIDSAPAAPLDTNEDQQQSLLQQQATTSEVASALQSLGGVVNVNEKVAIYRHPLFPLLRVLFEKCEIATNSIEHVDSINFDNEIKVFITQMAKENKPFFTDNVEVDTLVSI